MKKYDNMKRRKERLTITLPGDMLRILDGYIDGGDIRNRSHAIEHFLRQSLQPTVTTAIILAGGSFSGGIHPALTRIDGRLLADITLAELAAQEFTTVFMLTGSHTDTIRRAVGRQTYGLDIRWIPEARPLGTGGAVKRLEPRLSGPFLVLHGDILTRINLRDFVAFFHDEGSLASIAVKPRNSEPKYGQVMLQGNRITDFYEHDQGVGISIVNTGVYLLRPEALRLLPDDRAAKLETELFPKLAVMGELSAFFFQGMWFDVSGGTDLSEARKRWKLEGR